MNKYTIGNNETTITLPLDALTAQLKMQGLTLLLNHELPAFAAPPPASEGEIADSKKVFDALVAIANNERLIADSVADPILREMHLENQKAAQRICRTIYGATLPTREPEVKEKFAIRFSEWLMIQCDYKNHCVWEYQGEEYTQQELIEIFKRTTPLPSPTQSITN